ncbi:DEAD/DEAH box helicase [Aeromicrobium sp.]|uniref:DEAD/DEAH box helicase n=1 Tax=Aeromicrobium sp. TaxID=1871063 RepID=UPI0039E64BAC
MTTFTDLGVSPEIADALSAVGITEPFPIQEMTLQVALAGTDLIGQARTGTGKTLAFSIPVIQRVVAPGDEGYDQLAAPGKPQALIVAPTRELAIQVAGDVELASKNRGTRNLTIYGGVPYEPQLDALESGVDIVVGTPGRILDLANRRALDLSHVQALVLDEADEMLDLGFLPDVEAILAKTPASRQTMLFSATMPGAIVSLARSHMTQPMNIRAESAESNQTVPNTTQFVWQAHDLDKPEIVARVLQADEVQQIIVFTRTKRQAQRLADDLIDRGFPAAPLHGDMAQGSREKALQRFRDGKVTTLVATDVAARGIDVDNVSHVVNYTCPEDDKTYVHRIGRTGRAGRTGTAITFVDWADVQRWKLINKALELDFDEPEETYSSSEHLFAELNIPREAKGRLKPAAPREKKPAEAKSGGRSGGGRGGQNRGGQGGQRGPQQKSQASGEGSTSTGAPRKRRRRTRTRGGSPVQSESTAS